NVCLAPPRPRDELIALYARAVAVVNTSGFEGFPNTFMEAWACGVPVLSLSVDPDGVIERHGLGGVAHGSLERLAELGRSYWMRRGGLEAGAAGKEYIRRAHDPRRIGDAWLDLVRGLLR
ncbi:MAG: glycosyltransferase, partial [Actinobacteria bacterium]|nr:glycosyltransferase [Actinomycetota bacterium]